MAQNISSKAVALSAIPAFQLKKEKPVSSSVIQGMFMVAYTEGIPTYLKSPLIAKPDAPPSRPDNYKEEDLDEKFATVENKSKYWHDIRLIGMYLISPSKAVFDRYMEQKRKELGIADAFKIKIEEEDEGPRVGEGPGIGGGLRIGEGPRIGVGLQVGEEQRGEESGGRKERRLPGSSRPRVSLQEPADRTDPRVKALAESLFDRSVVNDGDVQSMIHGALGSMFSNWAAGNNVLNEDDLEEGVRKAVDGKLAEFKKKYVGIQLIDIIVVSAYSWRADKFMREEMERRGWVDFGKWQQFADQLIVSLRKLRRFTGAELYRCGRKGHEGEKLEKGTPFHAHSFLSTTYDKEALKGLEQDPKYVHGDTMKMSGNMEGYHMEEFSHFQGEREVILLPGHTLSAGGPRSGRNIPIAVTPPPVGFQPIRGDEPDAIAELEAARKEELLRLPPPPKKFLSKETQEKEFQDKY